MRIVQVTQRIKLNNSVETLATGERVWGGQFVSVRKRGLLVGGEFLLVVHSPGNDDFFFTGKAVVMEIRHLSSKPERYRYTFKGQSPLLMNWVKDVADKMEIFDKTEVKKDEATAHKV